MDAVANWSYVRMSLSARQKLAQKISEGVREFYEGEGVWVKYTSNTTHLLSAILERIDRASGTARIAFSLLMKLTGIKSRQTIARHIFLLEKAGCIAVTSKRIKRDWNAINVFRLLGDTALAFFGQKWSPKGVVEPIHRTDIYEYDGRTDNNKNMMDDRDIDPSTEILLGKIKTILDDGIGEKMIARHGAERVKAWYEWVIAQTWSTNPGGLLVHKLATGKMPPVGKQGQKQGRKAKEQTPEEWLAENADWLDEHGRPKASAFEPMPKEPEFVYPEWTADEWMVQDADAEIRARMGWADFRRDECSMWLIKRDGQRLVIGYDRKRINLRRLTNFGMFENLVRRILREWDVVFEQGDSREWFLSLAEKNRESAVA